MKLLYRLLEAVVDVLVAVVLEAVEGDVDGLSGVGSVEETGGADYRKSEVSSEVTATRWTLKEPRFSNRAAQGEAISESPAPKRAQRHSSFPHDTPPGHRSARLRHGVGLAIWNSRLLG